MALIQFGSTCVAQWSIRPQFAVRAYYPSRVQSSRQQKYDFPLFVFVLQSWHNDIETNFCGFKEFLGWYVDISHLKVSLHRIIIKVRV